MAAARFPNVFIVTYGRSGSTLLQGCLNAIPGYLVRGENADLVGRLLAIVDGLSKWVHQPRADTPAGAWFGADRFERDFLASCSRQMVDQILLRDVQRTELRAYGFKEIRYSAEDVEQKIAFLEQMYPRCGLIFNIRDPDDVVRSEFQKGQDSAKFAGLNRLFERLAAIGKNRHLVAYEDICGLKGSFVSLFDFLGEPFDRDSLISVMRTKHSYHGRTTRHFSKVPFFARVAESLSPFGALAIDRVKQLPRGVQVIGRLASAEPMVATAFREQSGRELKATFSQAEEAQPPQPVAGLDVQRFWICIGMPAGSAQEATVLYRDEPIIRLFNLEKL